MGGEGGGENGQGRCSCTRMACTLRCSSPPCPSSATPSHPHPLSVPPSFPAPLTSLFPSPLPPPSPVQENIDGDLASRVLGLLPIMDEGFHGQRYNERSKQRLDMAVINFFQCFRKVYIGEQVWGSVGKCGGRCGS